MLAIHIHIMNFCLYVKFNAILPLNELQSCFSIWLIPQVQNEVHCKQTYQAHQHTVRL